MTFSRTLVTVFLLTGLLSSHILARFTISSSTKLECGRTIPIKARRVVNGGEVVPHSIPWMVNIQQLDEHDCGGVLIKPDWVLTTAKCFMNPDGGYRDPTHKSVILGDHDLSTHDQYEQKLGISQVLIHNEFKSTDPLNNIALVKLQKPAVISKHVNVICLPDEDETLEPKLLRFSGWGKTLGTGRQVILRQVDLPLVSDEVCNKTYPKYFSNDQFCAGLEAGGKGPCHGDGGGPATFQMADGRWKLMGLVSWGAGCAVPGKFTVQVRISYFRKWIDMMSDEDCHATGTCCPEPMSNYYKIVPGTGCTKFLHGDHVIYKPTSCPKGTIFDTSACACNFKAKCLV